MTSYFQNALPVLGVEMYNVNINDCLSILVVELRDMNISEDASAAETFESGRSPVYQGTTLTGFTAKQIILHICETPHFYFDNRISV